MMPHKPLAVDPEFVERFWSKVDVRSDDECWPWIAYLSDSGYGRVSAGFHLGGPAVWMASRVAYTLAIGRIRRGAELDHVCHTEDVTCVTGALCPHRACVNPAHLEPVSHRENARRREVRILTCVNGHPRNKENRGPNGRGPKETKCKVCHREREAARRRAA